MNDRVTTKTTIQEIYDRCLQNHWRFASHHRQAKVVNMYRLYVQPVFGKKQLWQIMRSQVREWMDSMSHIPDGANQAYSVLSKLFTYAKECSDLDIPNPCEYVKRYPAKTRAKYAMPDDLQRIGAFLEANEYKYPRQCVYIYLVLFTGARPESIEKMLRKDIEIFHTKKGTPIGKIHFKGKTGTELIFIPEFLLEKIAKLPNEGTLTGIKMPKVFWRKLVKATGTEGLWLRDLRRTFATVAYNNDEKIDMIGDLLNHRSTQTTKIYARLMLSDRAEAMERIGRRLKELM